MDLLPDREASSLAAWLAKRQGSRWSAAIATAYERHRLWSADGTWERLLQQVQPEADAAGEIDWDVSVDSTIVRAHQHAAGARTDPPPALTASKGEKALEHQRESPWQSLVGRLVEVVRETRAWAAHAAASPARST